jgi:hypothetical protein
VLRHVTITGFAGAVLLAGGGLAAGALPARDLFGLATPRAHPGWGLVVSYAGLALLIAAWWRLGKPIRAGGVRDPRKLIGTLALWAAPLLLAPPLFSRDVYSYLAQGAMVGAGLDVYRHGPAVFGGPLAAEVPAVWQHTPTPYGPLFLLVAAGVAAVSGAHLTAGVLGMRLVAVAGVALVTAVLPGLARRCGVDPAAALWLGVLNPLVLTHLVAGAHNDALMLGLFVAGLAAALARYPACGAALIALAALVKAPAALGLLFVAPIWWGQLDGRWGRVRAALATGAVAAGTTVVVTAVAGTGYGWVGALDTPVSPRNWSLVGGLGHLTGALSLWRWIGLAAAVACGLALWLRRDRLGPVYAIGLCLGAFVLFGPALRPWYLLWGLVPLAAAAPDGRMRRVAAVACAVLAVVVLPSGFAPGAEQIAQAALGVALAAALIAALRPTRATDAHIPVPAR